MTLIKTYEELRFTDPFMFAKVMRDPTTCKDVLEVLLGIKLRRIEYVETEKTLEIEASAKGIRIDAYVEDESGTIYDIEMQTIKSDHLPKRSRYDQGIIDLHSIEKGAFYQELKRSFVIFLCTFDWFGMHKSIYTFHYTCQEIPGLPLGDGTTRIFINAAGVRDGLSEPQRIFLDYIMGHAPADDLTQRIETVVARSRTNQEWRREYVKLAANYRMFMEEGISSDRIIEKLQKFFHLSAEDAATYFQRFSPFEKD